MASWKTRRRLSGFGNDRGCEAQACSNLNAQLRGVGSSRSACRHRAFMRTLLSSARGQMCFCQRGGFTDEIVQFTGHSRELVRNSIWNNDHIAFGDLMFLAAFDFGTADFVRRDFLCIDGFPTRDQCGRSIDYINDIGVERMNFSPAGLDPPASVNLVAGGFQ